MWRSVGFEHSPNAHVKVQSVQAHVKDPSLSLADQLQGLNVCKDVHDSAG